MSTSVQQPQQRSPSVFPLHLQINNGLLGGVTFNLFLLLNPFKEKVLGFGQLTQPVNPPLDIHTEIKGVYYYMALMPPGKTTIGIKGEGYSMADNEQSQQLNVKNLLIVLNEDWISDTADYEYLNENGNWQQVIKAKVTAVDMK